MRSADGTVTLTGKVPSAFEAMIAYRAAQQTPGVREIVDRLEFTVPDEDHPNPLLQRGRPEDLEPYLASQIRRHVGDLAHIDRIQASGDVIEIRGTLAEGQNRDRLLAILRPSRFWAASASNPISLPSDARDECKALGDATKPSAFAQSPPQSDDARRIGKL